MNFPGDITQKGYEKKRTRLLAPYIPKPGELLDLVLFLGVSRCAGENTATSLPLMNPIKGPQSFGRHGNTELPFPSSVCSGDRFSI